ncbi:MAG: WecB/TagA/CpsF family glycosyltransferase [Deltaproteobacteria bacterium]|nr:WecB/TagA/CpsF family glycosyltransferase [Deltaproteobacteria bacterium]
MIERVRVGRVWIDKLTRPEALERVADLVRAGRGGTVVTPNIDHLVNVEHDARLLAAYAKADLSLVDSQLVLWATHLLGTPLPERLSGSDLVEPLMEFAAKRGLAVFLLGGSRGAAARSAGLLTARWGVRIAGYDDPFIHTEGAADEADIVERIRSTGAQLVLVALGSPKQELFMERNRERLAPAVSFGVGASLDFVAGTVRRAPKWMSRVGLEWFFRLLQEPRRLAHRYLVNDPQIVGILLRTWREPRERRRTQTGS